MKNLDIAKQWARKHSWGLLMLIGLLILSSWAVKHFKRPGQMTVIESQAMDMTAMKPPVGSVPVATEIVSRGSFNSKVRYTGTVAPYNEQNIFPRVEGWLTGLKVYNGDRVSSGQLLATLDSPDLQNKYSEAAYGHAASLKEVPVAQANLSKMRAERNAAQKEIRAAEQEVIAARAEVKASERMVSQAQKELKSGQASLAYWKKEIKREENLLNAGAVSQQEYDSELAEMIAAEADVEMREAKVEEAKANVEAARAELSNKQISIQIAKDMASGADAALKGAVGEVGQKSAMAQMAGASKATAATFNQYRQIRAPFSGVVTKRYLSPGVLVTPGTAILNVAQIDKVRLQANVAEQDLNSVSVGSRVTARLAKNSGKMIIAIVTSVAPSADPGSRTSIVEAVVDNSSHILFPGDFVSMEISTSDSVDAITVPTGALVAKDGRDAIWITECTEPSGETTYYCTMHPEVVSDKPGICPKCNMNLEPKSASTGKTAKMVYVTVGKTDGDRTEIVTGLNEGDEVIYKGQRYLREGDAVSVVEWDENGPKDLPAPAGGSMEMPGHAGHESMAAPSKSDNHSGHTQSSGTAKPKAGNKGSSVKDMYTCPMHPEFVTDDPNALCPKCNMKVEKMILDAHKKH
ncbi:MAG: efflux RND transporter periplasmic adaptor subunit [Armatimonadota bacterium]